MNKKGYDSMKPNFEVSRRDFLKTGLTAGLVLGTPTLWAQEKEKSPKKRRTATNIDEVMKIPRTKNSLPGPFPGKVVEVSDPKAMEKEKPNAKVIDAMVRKGIENLTGKSLAESFGLFFNKDDVVGIKVNPVGPGLISTRLEVVDAVIDWLVAGGMAKKNIIIWDRIDFMLTDAGFTAKRYPGIGIEGLQTMDLEVATGEKKDNSAWLDKEGNHVSAASFDKKVFYWADVDGPKGLPYLNQHVFNGKHSYFGKLVTQKLTKIINIPVFKNTGNGISMATKNIGYGAICNTNRLHKPLFFDVCTEVMAFPAIRDKLVLNITDGLRAQYEGGPMPAAKFTYLYNTLFFAGDSFASDMVCHNLLVKKRKEMGISVNEHPKYTEYLHYAERLGLGVVDKKKIRHIRV